MASDKTITSTFWVSSKTAFRKATSCSSLRLSEWTIFDKLLASSWASSTQASFSFINSISLTVSTNFFSISRLLFRAEDAFFSAASWPINAAASCPSSTPFFLVRAAIFVSYNRYILARAPPVVQSLSGNSKSSLSIERFPVPWLWELEVSIWNTQDISSALILPNGLLGWTDTSEWFLWSSVAWNKHNACDNGKYKHLLQSYSRTISHKKGMKTVLQYFYSLRQ